MRMHVGLHATDLARSIDFYRRFLGVEPVKIRTDYAKFELSEPGLVLTLDRVASTPGIGNVSHLGLRVSSAAELAGARRRVVEAGLEPYDQTDTTCCYARQDKFWVTDPDGTPWETYLFLADADRRDDADEASCIPAAAECSEASTTSDSRSARLCC